MKSFLAILRREIAERKLLFVGAAFASLFPIVAPWIPGLSGQNSADLRGSLALGLALITSSLLALVLGVTTLAQDLSERRTGFYFARPVPGWALWAGKMASAALLSLGSGALILLVAVLAGGKIDPTGYWGPMSLDGRTSGMPVLSLFSVVILGVLLLLAAGHAVSIMVRSRSPWLAVDLVAFSLVAIAFWSGTRSLQREGAMVAYGYGVLGWLAVSLAALFLAGLVQVTGGRTDLRRGHRLLSLTLWGLVGAATLGHAAFVRWTLDVTPRDLTILRATRPAPAGSWIAVSGIARSRGGYSPTFLLDTASGRFVHLPGGYPYWWGLPHFSPDGTHAFWFEPLGGDADQLLSIDLRSPEPALRRTGIVYSGDYRIAPSSDGRRVAALVRGRLTVDDLAAGRMLASVPMVGRAYLFFPQADRVRVLRISYEEPGMPEVWRLTTLDLDVAKNQLQRVSHIELPGELRTWNLAPDGRRAILRRLNNPEDLIADLETGRVTSISAERSSLHFLSDGRIVRLHGIADQTFLSLLTADGGERLQVPLPGVRFQLGSMVSPDLLAFAAAERGFSQATEAWTSWLLDLKTGRLRKIGPAMVPAVVDAEVGSPASRLFYRKPGGLTFFDPETGRLRNVLQGQPIASGFWLADDRVTRPQQP